MTEYSSTSASNAKYRDSWSPVPGGSPQIASVVANGEKVSDEPSRL